MNHQIIALGYLVLLAVSGCTYENIGPHPDIPPSSIEYLIFGHTQGFCLNCDAVYKIENAKLYGADHQVISDPAAVQFKLLPDSSYQLVRSLPSKIPSQLVQGSTASIQTIGTYFPDVGHTYIEVSRNHQVYRWYIEAGNTPNYLTDFLNAVNDALSKLR